MKKYITTIAFVATLLVPQFAHADILTGLVGWYTFDEGSGSTAHDSSGNANTATVNGASWIAGKIGTHALSFNGSGNNVLTPIYNLTNASGTISWWMNPSSAYNSGTVRAIWGQFVSSPYSEMSCQVYSDNNWYCGFSSTTDRRVTLAASGSNYIQGSWNFYTFTWTSTSSALYMNGSVIGTNGTAPNPSLVSSDFTIGEQGYGYSTYFLGDIDDFRIYNRALSTSDIIQLYNYTAPVTSPFFNQFRLGIGKILRIAKGIKLTIN